MNYEIRSRESSPEGEILRATVSSLLRTNKRTNSSSTPPFFSVLRTSRKTWKKIERLV